MHKYRKRDSARLLSYQLFGLADVCKGWFEFRVYYTHTLGCHINFAVYTREEGFNCKSRNRTDRRLRLIGSYTVFVYRIYTCVYEPVRFAEPYRF